jgi:hypothetical protein
LNHSRHRGGRGRRKGGDMMSKKDEMAKLIDKVILDPIWLRRLSDRVYALMVEDMRNQSERTGNRRMR